MRKILVIRGGSLGDFVLTLPILKSLKRGFPDAQIELIGRFPFSLLGREYLSHIYPLIDPRFAPLYIDSSLAGELIEYLDSFNIVISYIGDLNSIFNQHLRRLKGESFLHCNADPENLKIHAIDHLLTPLRTLRIDSYHMPEVRLHEKEKRYASEFRQKHSLSGKRVVIIHPGSGSKKKRWKAEYFIELYRLLEKRKNTEVFFILGEAEDDLRDTLGKAGKSIRFIFDLPLLKVAAILQSSYLYIGNDSGITHLSAALGTPTIAIFGPTDPKKWGPRGKAVEIINKETPCSPCSREERNHCPHQRCLDAISVGDVMSRTEKFLGSF